METHAADATAFISRWTGTGGSEMGSAQMFAEELCDLLGVEKPLPVKEDGSADHYCFEKPVSKVDGGGGRIDLYKKGCFIWEAKQGIEGAGETSRTGHGKRGTPTFARVLMEAKGQADAYARAVAKEDGWPPFLMVVDVGKTIQLWADFSLAGHGYTHFPDRGSFEIQLGDLADSSHRIYSVAVTAGDMAKIVDYLADQRISPTHRTKALKRGGWSIGKINGKRVYWRGDSKPPNIDRNLLDEVCSS